MSETTSRNDSEAKTLGKVFIGGLSWGSSSDTLKEYFSLYGEIVDAIIMLDKVSMRSRGFGFVTFSDPAAVEAVLNDNHVIDGRPVEVKRAVSKEEMESSQTQQQHIMESNKPPVIRTKKVFVGGLAHTVNDEAFRKYFEQFGNVVESQVMVDHDSGRHRGFGFVTFDEEDTVDKIMEMNHEIDSKMVEIKRAEPKRPVKIGRSHFQPMSPGGGVMGRGGMRSWGRVGGGMGGGMGPMGGGGFSYNGGGGGGGGFNRGGYDGGARQGGFVYGGGGGGEYGGGNGGGYGVANNNNMGYGMPSGNWGMDQPMYGGMGMMGAGGYSGYAQPTYGSAAGVGAVGGNAYGYGGFGGGGDSGSMSGRNFQRSGRAYHPYKNQPQ